MVILGRNYISPCNYWKSNLWKMLFPYILMKATVVYRCSKVLNRLRVNKSGLQTKTEVNT